MFEFAIYIIGLVCVCDFFLTSYAISIFRNAIFCAFPLVYYVLAWFFRTIKYLCAFVLCFGFPALEDNPDELKKKSRKRLVIRKKTTETV